MKDWYRSFNWKERVIQREAEQSKQIEKEGREAGLDWQRQMHSIISAQRNMLARQINSERNAKPGEKKPLHDSASWSDFCRLSKLDVLLRGHSSKVEIGVSRATQTALINTLMKALHKTVPARCPGCQMKLSILPKVGEEFRRLTAHLGEGSA